MTTSWTLSYQDDNLFAASLYSSQVSITYYFFIPTSNLSFSVTSPESLTLSIPPGAIGELIYYCDNSSEEFILKASISFSKAKLLVNKHISSNTINLPSSLSSPNTLDLEKKWLIDAQKNGYFDFYGEVGGSDF